MSTFYCQSGARGAARQRRTSTSWSPRRDDSNGIFRLRFPLLPDVDGGLRELCFFHTGDSTTIEGDKSGRALGREVFLVVVTGLSLLAPLWVASLRGQSQGHSLKLRTRLRCLEEQFHIQEVCDKRLVGLCGAVAPSQLHGWCQHTAYPNHTPQLAPYHGAHLPWAQRISSPF